MAVVKLGAIITGIAGSIGGWSFRRSQGSTVVYNRPRGGSKNRLLLNQALGSLRGVIQSWAALSVGSRNGWKNATGLFLFPDKFGTMRSLNARMFYIKLTARRDLIGQASPNPNTLDSTVIVNSIVAGSIVTGGIKQLEMNNLAADTDYIVQIEKVKNDSIAPTFTRRKMLMHTQLGVSVDITFTAEFDALFPNAVVGENYIVYVTGQNSDGFRATPLAIKILST